MCVEEGREDGVGAWAGVGDTVGDIGAGWAGGAVGFDVLA